MGDLHFPKGHNAAIYSLAFRPTSPLLCSGDYDGVINLWDLSAGVLSTVLQHQVGRFYGVGGLAFKPDGQILAAGAMDKGDKLTLWNVDTRKSLLSLDSIDDKLAWSPNGQLLACGADQAILRDGATGKTLQTFSGHNDWVTCLAFSRDGKQLATGTASEDGNLRVWDVSSGGLITTLLKPGWQAEQIVFLTENTLLFTTGYGTLYEWKLSNSQDQLLFQPPKGGSAGYSTAISSDGALLAYEIEEGDRYVSAHRTETGDFIVERGEGYASTIHVIDVRSRRELHVFSGHIEDISCMTFDSNATRLASADQSGHIFVWDIHH